MYKNILVAIDGSPTSNLALLETVNLVAADTSVRVVTVTDNPVLVIPLDMDVNAVYDVEFMHTSLLKAAKDILDRAKALLQHKGINAKTHLIDLSEASSGTIASAIMKEAEEWPADVIIVGTHGRRGFNRLLMGSVAESLIRIATKPVLLVRAPGASDSTDKASAAQASENNVTASDTEGMH